MFSRLFARSSSQLTTRRYSTDSKWYTSLPSITDQSRRKLVEAKETNLQRSVSWMENQLASPESEIGKKILYKANNGERSLTIYYYDIPEASFYDSVHQNQKFVDLLNTKFRDHLSFANYSSPHCVRYFTINW